MAIRTPMNWLLDMFNSDPARVSESTILSSPTVWYCTNLISGDLAKMPLEVRREDSEGGFELYRKHPSYKLLSNQANDYQTADCFKENLTAHALNWGNGRAAIVRDGTRPVELIPMLPDRSDTVMVDGEVYHVTMPLADDPLLFRSVMETESPSELVNRNDLVVLHDRDVLHIKGFGYNGYEGVSIARVLQNTIGIDLQSQKYANDGMKRGFAGEVMLEAPTGLFRNEDEARQFLDGFRKRHERGQDGETVGLLREGLKANVLSISPSDSQFLEQRAFSRQDVAMIFGMHSLPFEESASSYNSLEQKQLAYLASCLDRWLVRWEFQCDMKLRSEAEKRIDAVHHVFDRMSWLRTDISSKQEVTSGLLSSMVINRNEARKWWNLNPVEGGDEFLNPFTTTGDEEVVEDEELEEEPVEEVEDEDEAEIVENRLKYLITLEASRIIEMSERKDFLDQLDGFFSKWAITLLNNNIPADKVKSITEGHKDGILELSGSVESLQQLREQLPNLTAGW